MKDYIITLRISNTNMTEDEINEVLNEAQDFIFGIYDDDNLDVTLDIVDIIRD